jgi:hypothetical protein
MNRIDVLPKTPSSFSSIEEKLETKKLGVHQPRDLKLQPSGKNKNRLFSTSWFDKKIRLTVSEESKSFFCFVRFVWGRK